MELTKKDLEQELVVVRDMSANLERALAINKLAELSFLRELKRFKK